mgnify:CR=1 FL=1
MGVSSLRIGHVLGEKGGPFRKAFDEWHKNMGLIVMFLQEARSR